MNTYKMESEGLNWVRKITETDLSMKNAGCGNRMHVEYHEDMPVLVFPALKEIPWICHAFSTRIGGVTEGCASSLNFSVKTYDTEENVRENYRRMAKALGVIPEKIVLSKQTHTTNVRVVTAEDAGKGYHILRDYDNVDGLITNVPGITLVTHYADCVPLYFVDPVHRAIGCSHSGWRGTVGQMGKATLQKMREAYGTDPADVIAAIGPSICRSCYEISEDVALEFIRLLNSLQEDGLRMDGKDLEESLLLDRKPNGKFQLDLWMANRMILLNAGILPEHLHVTDICTCCNRELLHSHRATGGKRGTLGAFLSIRE